jgi:hypothetical protein
MHSNLRKQCKQLPRYEQNWTVCSDLQGAHAINTHTIFSSLLAVRLISNSQSLADNLGDWADKELERTEACMCGSTQKPACVVAHRSLHVWQFLYIVYCILYLLCIVYCVHCILQCFLFFPHLFSCIACESVKSPVQTF